MLGQDDHGQRCLISRCFSASNPELKLFLFFRLSMWCVADISYFPITKPHVVRDCPCITDLVQGLGMWGLKWPQGLKTGKLPQDDILSLYCPVFYIHKGRGPKYLWMCLSVRRKQEPHVRLSACLFISTASERGPCEARGEHEPWSV